MLKLVVVLLLAGAAAGAPQPDRVLVYVSAPIRDGFIDTNQEIQNSVKDLRGKLSGMKQLQLVDVPEGADIVVTVVARGVGSETYGERLSYAEYYNKAVLTTVPIWDNTFWVTAVMEVGTYKREFTGDVTHEYKYSGGAWGNCAKQIAKDLKSWVVANIGQIKRRRIGTKP